MTSNNLHEKSEIYHIRNVSKGGLLLSESFIYSRKIACHLQRCKVAAFWDRAEVYLWRHRSVALTWPDLRMKKFILFNVRLDWEVKHAPFQLSIAKSHRTMNNHEKTFEGGSLIPLWRRGFKTVLEIELMTGRFQSGSRYIICPLVTTNCIAGIFVDR